MKPPSLRLSPTVWSVTPKCHSGLRPCVWSRDLSRRARVHVCARPSDRLESAQGPPCAVWVGTLKRHPTQGYVEYRRRSCLVSLRGMASPPSPLGCGRQLRRRCSLKVKNFVHCQEKGQHLMYAVNMQPGHHRHGHLPSTPRRGSGALW